MMKRVWRWLWRQFLQVALGTLMIFGALSFASTPSFAEPSSRVVTAQEAPSGDPLTPQELARGHRHAAESRLISLGYLGYNVLLLSGFFLLGGTRALVRLSARVGRHWLLQLGAVAGVVSLGYTLLTLPLDYYAGFIFPHRYGLSTQTTTGWFTDYALSSGVGLVIWAPLLALFYAVLRRFPRTWWLWVTAASLPLSIFFMLIEPVFIAPLFNQFTPLRQKPLRRDILAMAHQQGIAAQDVYQMDASRRSRVVNAYVNGVGPSQRIVLYDTLLAWFTPAEVKCVMAHEMGHYVLKHIPKGIALSVLGTLVGSWAVMLLGGGLVRRWSARLGIGELAHPAAYPLLLALTMGISLLSVPPAAWVSRAMEREADAFALCIHPDYDAEISTYYKLARLNISELDPPRWVQWLYATHPSLGERIRRVEALRQTK